MAGNITQLFGAPFVNPPDPVPIIEQIRSAMLSAGITPPPNIIVDGNLHRFSTKPCDPTDDCGWYAIFPDGVQAGKFGDWRQGIEMNFKASIGRELSAAEAHAIHMRQVEAKKRRDELIAKKRSDASAECALIWSKAQAADEEHPYLQKKGIGYNGSRIAGDGRLIVPLYGSDGVISSIQYIDGDGEKRYYPGGATGGKYWVIGGPIKDKAYMAEGFATSATIHEETNLPVIVAYSANNLPPVLKEIRDLYPSITITIVADNDKSGVGQNYANQAAAKYGAMVIIPPSEGDANDFRQAGGDIKSLLMPQSQEWLMPIDDWCNQPAPVKWMVKGWIQENALVMIHGPSGSGKTFVLLDILLHMATGKDKWCGHKIKNVPIAYLAGEGHHGLRSRVVGWMQQNNEKPKNMWVSRGAIDLNTPEGCQRAMAYIKSLPVTPKIIAVDTLHRFMAGDENSSQDAKTMIDACAMLQKEFGATVILVHHTGASDDAQHRARGSSSWRGAMENEISIRPSGESIIIEAKKIKDAEEPAPIYVDLKSIDIDGWFDEDGDQVTTAIIEQVEQPAKKNKHDTTMQRNIREIRDAWFDSGAEINEGKPYISKMALKNYLVTRLDKSESSAKKEIQISSGRMITRMYESGILTDNGFGFLINNEIGDVWIMQKNE